MVSKQRIRAPQATRQRLLEAATALILTRGFTGTGIDQVCTSAGVTKGAFFHHFPSKDDLGKSALEEWARFGLAIYREACAGHLRDPLDHLHRLFDIMIDMVENSPTAVTCVVGIISQELAEANPTLRETCSRLLKDWNDFVKELLEEAKAASRPKINFDPEDVAWFLNSLWQGSLLVAKARRDPAITIRNLNHARAYVDNLFHSPKPQPKRNQNHEYLR